MQVAMGEAPLVNPEIELWIKKEPKEIATGD